jgi:riboflavin biosynthesis pyrimidine reductase
VPGWQDRPVQSLFPTAPSELRYVDLAELYAYPAESPWLRANFVTSLDGAAQGSDHRSGTLSSKADKRVFGLLRTLADVIVVGASTTRDEGYLPVTSNELRTSMRSSLGLAPLPSIAVVSRSLRLDPALLSGGDAPTLVITTESAPADQRAELGEVAEVIVAGDADIDARVAVDALVAKGFQRMLCEGGPTLLRSLVAAGCVDEICLTVAPIVLAGDRLRMTHGDAVDPPAHFTLRHLLEDDSQLFFRYTRN